MIRFLALFLILSNARQKAKKGVPHYANGVHNPEFDIDEESTFADHTCNELMKTYNARDVHQPTKWTPTLEIDAVLREDVEKLQNPNNCAQARLLLYALHSDCGFGAELHWLTVALRAALTTRRTLVVVENERWIYAEQPYCAEGSGTFSCYFEPLSSCTARTDAELAALLGDVTLKDVPVFTTKSIDDNEDVRVLQYTRDLQKQLDFPFFRSVPRRYSDLSHKADLLWFRSVLIHIIMNLQPRLNAYIDGQREAIGTGAHDLLGVHNRKGDKALGSKINNPEMKPLSFERVYALSRAVAMRCGFKGVFVATKDPECLQFIEEANKLESNRNDLLWVWDRTQPRVELGWSTHDLLQGKLNRTREALDVLTDIALLASLRGFVGTFESNLSRVVAELGFASGDLEFALAFNRTWFVFP